MTVAKGLGAWTVGSHTDTGVQQCESIDIGTGNLIDTSEQYFVNFPNAVYRSSYKVPTQSDPIGASGTPPSTVNDHNRDYSNAVVMGEEMVDAWIANDPADHATDLHGFFGAHGVFPKLSVAGFQTAAGSNGNGFMSRQNVNRLYYDNMHGYCVGTASNEPDMTQESKIPDGFTDNRDWRFNAVFPFIDAVCSTIRGAGNYIYMNCFDMHDASLGETIFSVDDMTTRTRYWAEIAANCTHKPNGVFVEYWCQFPDLAKQQLGEDAPRHRWTDHLRLIADAHTSGFDFHGLAYDDGSDGAIYAWATFLLGADLSRGDTLWVKADSGAFSNPNFFLDLGGAAAGSYQTTGSIRWRAYPNYTVFVNPSTSNDTQTIQGVSRTVNALSTLFVANPVPASAVAAFQPGSFQHNGWVGQLGSGVGGISSSEAFGRPTITVGAPPVPPIPPVLGGSSANDQTFMTARVSDSLGRGNVGSTDTPVGNVAVRDSATRDVTITDSLAARVMVTDRTN